jgi:hypothetical protein
VPDSYWLLPSSTIKKEAICASETSVDFHRTTQLYDPDNITLQSHRCKNNKFNILYFVIDRA